jgi:hypothetical protein
LRPEITTIFSHDAGWRCLQPMVEREGRLGLEHARVRVGCLGWR